MHERTQSEINRRGFLTATATALSTGAMAAPAVHTSKNAAEAEIKIGVIGCGGRGTGAMLDALGAATKVIYPATGYHTEDAAEGAKVQRKNVRIVALADLFQDRLARCLKQLDRLGIKVPKSQCFVGWDAYKELLAVSAVNYVILATPPYFRPEQLKAAVEVGKHVFMEKPVAVDPPGIRTVLQAGELAKQKGLGIAAGTQRRHQKSYCETIKRIQDGLIGEISYAKCYWNGSQVWVIERQPGWSDLEWQLRNWCHLVWLSGDHIVEQHVHNIDIMNWVLGSHPIRAYSGLGGRQVRTAPKYGNVYDHFAVEYEYPNGISVFSQCRQINGCQNIVGEMVVGTQGRSNCKDRIWLRSGKRWRYRGPNPNPYKQEHEDLIQSITRGEPINEAKAVAESTMAAIIGREAVYSGRAVTWEAAMKSNMRLGPEKLQFGPCPVEPVRMPGVYKFS